MKTIYKYSFEVTDEFVIEMPEGARILAVQAQYDYPHVWATVDTDLPMEERKFRILGTGKPIGINNTEELVYIGTFQLHKGTFVGHLFEVIAVDPTPNQRKDK